MDTRNTKKRIENANITKFQVKFYIYTFRLHSLENIFNMTFAYNLILKESQDPLKY